MLEGRSGAHVPSDQGESVWLVGDRITVKLASEDTGGVYSMVEEVTPPKAGRPRTHTATKTRRCICWRARSSSYSARRPSRQARGRASTLLGAFSILGGTSALRPARYLASSRRGAGAVLLGGGRVGTGGFIPAGRRTGRGKAHVARGEVRR